MIILGVIINIISIIYYYRPNRFEIYYNNTTQSEDGTQNLCHHDLCHPNNSTYVIPHETTLLQEVLLV